MDAVFSTSNSFAELASGQGELDRLSGYVNVMWPGDANLYESIAEQAR